MTRYLRPYPFTWLIVAVVIYLSFFTPPSTPVDDVPGIDKLVHTGMYGFLCLVIWYERLRLEHAISRVRCIVGAVVVPFLMSGAIELMQEYCTDHRRSGDWWDLAANTLGILIVWALAEWYMKGKDKG